MWDGKSESRQPVLLCAQQECTTKDRERPENTTLNEFCQTFLICGSHSLSIHKVMHKQRTKMEKWNCAGEAVNGRGRAKKRGENVCHINGSYSRETWWGLCRAIAISCFPASWFPCTAMWSLNAFMPFSIGLWTFRPHWLSLFSSCVSNEPGVLGTTMILRRNPDLDLTGSE